MIEGATIGAVLIGRNEGLRLMQCLRSVPECVDVLVYVDSGSDDNSVEVARTKGAKVVALDMSRPFTAARARNEGAAHLKLISPTDFIQFIDGDCELQPGWIESAYTFMSDKPRVAVTCGRRRERFPEVSVYNRMCDHEWNSPVGQAKSCGGDALMRSVAFDEVGGFDNNVIAGEEPELCVRLRAKGWQIWRLDQEMTLHDAALIRFSQWWKRARRGGHAFAQGAAMHGGPPEYHRVRETCRALLWGFALPLFAVLGAVVTPFSLLFLLIYPAQLIRLALQFGPARLESWQRAFFITLAKLPEALGVLQFCLNRLFNKQTKIIEYK